MTKVNLYIYDITKGMARQLSLPLLGKQIDGVWHTSIVCFGKEYFFGSYGIDDCPPCGMVLGPPDETVNLGETSVSKKIFYEYLSGLSKETFRPEKYHLFKHNCNAFTNEVAQFLTGKKIPSYITDLPEEVMSTPFGAMISQYFDNVQIHQEPSENSQHHRSFSGIDDELDTNEQFTDLAMEPPKHAHSSCIDSFHSNLEATSLMPATYKVEEDELSESIKYLKKNFEEYTKNLDKLHCILEEIELDFSNEDENRKEITESLGCLCKELESKDGSADAFKSLLAVLKATALNLSKIFKFAEGDEIILTVMNKLERGHANEVKLLRIQFLTNLLSVYELRNHLLAIESMLRTLVNLTVSSVLDGPGPQIREAGCCLAYSLSIVKLNDDHAFELASALLHVASELDKNTTAWKYCIAALKNFVRKSDQVAELAKMIIPEFCESELDLKM